MIFAIAVLLFSFFSTQSWGAPPQLFSDSLLTVAIDPGHGGKDGGAAGSEGLLEKSICFSLTQQLSSELEAAYRIVLTRSGDYDVSLPERAAIANHQKADVLVSIHTSASFQSAASGIRIYSYKPNHIPAAAGSGVEKTGGATWRHLQLVHMAVSRSLAQALQRAFRTIPGGPPVHLHQAPLALLAGAAMPAVVVEVGCLSHPAAARQLAMQAQQATYARALAEGIEDFLTSTRN
ncbi:MAG: N-acetylmuramoyl-L-alanine amidase [Desulfatitalea sp.]|nr:N-acetylmuramoyl-L-alanine amidase [Desulfatitalea sp.]